MRSLLPGSLRELAGRISMQALIKLTEVLGGTRVCVPNRPNSTSRLAAALSPEDFAVLCSIFRGEVINIPRGVSLHRWLRDKQVLELRAAGASIRELATRMHIAERSVWAILATHREAEKTVRAASPTGSKVGRSAVAQGARDRVARAGSSTRKGNT